MENGNLPLCGFPAANTQCWQRWGALDSLPSNSSKHPFVKKQHIHHHPPCPSQALCSLSSSVPPRPCRMQGCLSQSHWCWGADLSPPYSTGSVHVLTLPVQASILCHKWCCPSSSCRETSARANWGEILSEETSSLQCLHSGFSDMDFLTTWARDTPAPYRHWDISASLHELTDQQELPLAGRKTRDSQEDPTAITRCHQHWGPGFPLQRDLTWCMPQLPYSQQGTTTALPLPAASQLETNHSLPCFTPQVHGIFLSVSSQSCQQGRVTETLPSLAAAWLCGGRH